MLDDEFAAMTDEEFDEQMKRGFLPLFVSCEDGTTGISNPTMTEVVEATGQTPLEIRESLKGLVERGWTIPIDTDGRPSFFHLVKAMSDIDAARWMLKVGWIENVGTAEGENLYSLVGWPEELVGLYIIPGLEEEEKETKPLLLPLEDWRETGRFKKFDEATVYVLSHIIPDSDGELDLEGRTLVQFLMDEVPEVNSKRQARKTIQRLVQNGWIEKQNGQYRFII